ncbi:hypothetical protein BDR07DRAFT_259635 [Suillus spraguei]|nr:hypothetical protein BDR07DRAFT_259635 [Suillus spraguei]
MLGFKSGSYNKSSCPTEKDQLNYESTEAIISTHINLSHHYEAKDATQTSGLAPTMFCIKVIDRKGTKLYQSPNSNNARAWFTPVAKSKVPSLLGGNEPSMQLILFEGM